MNKKTTLKLNRDFRRLYYKGSSAVHPLIVTYASKNRLGYNRIGITVTKKSTELEPVLKKQIQSLTRPDKSKPNANPAKAKGRSPKKNLPKGQKASEHRGAAREQ